MSEIDYVTGVAFYPIKGARAATVNGYVPRSLSVGRTGFSVSGVRDRDWVLWDPNARAFVSQRGWSDQGKRVVHRSDRQLATVGVDVRSDHVEVTSAIGALQISSLPDALGTRLTLDIFGKQFPGINQGPEAARYFSKLLDREVLLVRSDRERPRMLPERYRRNGAFNFVAGADGMPFLLTSEASLRAAHEANGMEPGTVPMGVYRPNIVIAGDRLGAFGEDYINGQVQFGIGTIGMWAVKACSRCPVPEVNQETGELGAGGLTVLRHRRGEIFTGEKGVFFGQNLVHANIGSISVGDEVIVGGMMQTPNIVFAGA